MHSSHVLLARWFYTRPGERPHPQDVIGANSWTELSTDSAFAELLDIDHGRREDLAIVRGFRHETIGEFLIAKSIVAAFLLGGSAIDDVLTVTVRDDVNIYVRSAINQLGQHRLAAILANLAQRFESIEQDDAFRSTNAAERLREQILYYVGRLPVADAAQILVSAFHRETNPLLRRSAALGAILHGREDVESEYMLMLEQPEEAILNRSVQMVYFGDVHGDLHTFRDGGEDWPKSRRAILGRLSQNSVRDRRLRLWDLKTLKSFLTTREDTGLDARELHVLHGLVDSKVSTARDEEIRREVMQILQLPRDPSIA
ncbi:hypothetical protein [Paractinoplanes durhamensis]|uniref:hypothetical protein n=1 Tax=Paractinoplanes durhamensis TaxID=113563 RepID=UPI00362747F7